MDSSGDGNSTLQNAKDAVYGNAQAASNTVQNHPATKTMKETLGNGPVADKVKDQSAKTSSELQNLRNARTPPEQYASTGQPLTHYHSFFYSLLSWENPRASGIAFAATVLFIFAYRYLPMLRWAFKVLYLLLGATAAAEVAGKLVFSQGLASSFRPKRYYTIPREALEAALEDVEQLINFFVIEFQRILFAENVTATIAACSASFISYWLIKIVPLWGMSLIGVSCIFLGPLIYVNNKELIDTHLANAHELVNNQASQVKDLAGQHTARYSETVKQYAGDYSAKAQNYIGSARGKSPKAGRKSSAPSVAGPGSAPNLSSRDFPHAPKQEPTPGVTSHQEQFENSQFGGQAEPAS